MRALIGITLMAAITLATANTCNGFDSPEVKELVAASDNMKKYVKDDAAFARIRGKISVRAQVELNGMGVEPIDFSDAKHRVDLLVLGEIEIESVTEDGEHIKNKGSAVKVGNSCVATSAHILYQSLHQKISQDNSGPFDKRITFTRGVGNTKESFEASVFFQMTQEGIDWFLRGTDDKKRVFYGHHDLVLLKLNRHDDPHFRTINVLSPSQVRNRTNPDLGKEMMCQGSPYYKTSRSYGYCKGHDFRWKQEKARVFEDDISDKKGGIASNLASGPGFSGGPCYLREVPNEVFALVSSGFGGDDPRNPDLPSLEFGGNYSGNKAAYLSLFHILNQRMEKELGSLLSG